MIKKLGLIAGHGCLPTIAANNAYNKNIDLQIYSTSKDKNRNKEYNPKLHHLINKISITRLGSVIKQLKKDQISDVLFLGKIDKKDIFKNLLFDKTTLSILKSLINRNDNTIFDRVLKEFEKHNLNIISQRKFLKNLVLPKGTYSKKQPSKADWEDIQYGMFYAKKMSSLDIGQTIVTRDKSIIAVEAIEGTDECIRRAGNLIYKKHGIVCKAERKKQDDRFDIPTIGLQTMKVMKESGCQILVIEANKTLVVTPEKIKEMVNKLGMILVSV